MKRSSIPKVEAAAPYVSAQGMVSFDQIVSGVVVRGILPDMENSVADLARDDGGRRA